MTTPLGLYVHIPFCKARCHYCDFATGIGSADDIDAYLDLLEEEAAREAVNQPIDTIFIGGGTPSILDGSQRTRLFRDILGRFELTPDAEVSTEANPESMDRKTAEDLAALGVNRVSLGGQSFDAEELRRLGRLHSVQGIHDAVGSLRAAGIRNINLDLICAFPGNTAERFQRSLEALLKLGPPHVSVYMYQHEDESHWGGMDVEPPDEDLQVELYYQAKDLLEGAGYLHYEISNFARPGHECRHNLKYWCSDSYLGLGLSAVRYVDGVRLSNPRDMDSYVKTAGTGLRESTCLDPIAREREELMLRLRLLPGATGAPAVPGEALGHEVQEVLERYRSLGLVDRYGSGYVLSRRGIALSNEVFAELI